MERSTAVRNAGLSSPRRPRTSAPLLRARPPPRARTELAGSPAGELVSDPRSEVVPILAVVSPTTTRRARRSISRVHSSRAIAGSSTAASSRLASNRPRCRRAPRPAATSPLGAGPAHQCSRSHGSGLRTNDSRPTDRCRFVAANARRPGRPRARGRRTLICPMTCPTSCVRNGSIRRDTGRMLADAWTRNVVVDLGQYGTWRAQATPGGWSPSVS